MTTFTRVMTAFGDELCSIGARFNQAFVVRPHPTVYNVTGKQYFMTPLCTARDNSNLEELKLEFELSFWGFIERIPNPSLAADIHHFVQSIMTFIKDPRLDNVPKQFLQKYKEGCQYYEWKKGGRDEVEYEEAFAWYEPREEKNELKAVYNSREKGHALQAGLVFREHKWRIGIIGAGLAIVGVVGVAGIVLMAIGVLPGIGLSMTTAVIYGIGVPSGVLAIAGAAVVGTTVAYNWNFPRENSGLKRSDLVSSNYYKKLLDEVRTDESKIKVKSGTISESSSTLFTNSRSNSSVSGGEEQKQYEQTDNSGNSIVTVPL